MYCYRNRYCNPATGRFIGEDPIGWASGQTNAYAYVGGNPVQLTIRAARNEGDHTIDFRVLGMYIR